MESLRTLIADSDAQALARLRAVLGRRADLRVVAECTDGFQAADSIGRHRPDVAFLDLQLAGMDGLAVCGQFGEFRPQIVFTSSTAEGAVRAFELPAVDFVLKPFADHRLLASIERVRQAVAAKVGRVPVEEFRALLRETVGGRPEHLAVRSRRVILLLPLADISWVEAQGTSVRIHAGRKSHMLRSSLTAIEERLPADRFMRVHREAIVNLGRVQELLPWLHGDLRIVLCDGTMVPLARRYRKDLESKLSIARLPAEA
jgi:two-component system, LytTR family, response regulator